MALARRMGTCSAMRPSHDLHHAVAGRQRLAQQLREAVKIVRAKHQIDVWTQAQQLFGYALLLHHAAAHADDQVGLLPLEQVQRTDVARDPPLRVVTHAAGIEQDDIGLLVALRGRIAHLGEHARQLLGVVFVHLAAIGNDFVLTAARLRPHTGHVFPLLCKLFIADEDGSTL